MSLATLTVELQGNVSKLESDMAEMRNVVQMYMERIGVAANDASKHIEGVAQAGRQVQRSRGVDEAVEGMNHLNFSTVGARRELLVLAHELSQGNFKRAAGSVMVLGERIDAMSLIFSRAGLTILGVGAALVAFGVAAYKAYDEAQELNKALELSNNYAGMTAANIRSLARQLDATNGHYRDNVAMLTTLAETGRFAGETLVAAGRAATQMEQKTGAATKDVLAEILKIDDGAAKWAESMNKHYHFVTSAQFEYIRALEEAGDKEKAEAVALNLLADRFDALGKKTGIAADFVRGWGIILGNTWQQILKIVNGKDVDERMQDTLSKLADMQKRMIIAQGLGRDTSKLKAAIDEEYAHLKNMSDKKTADEKKAAEQSARDKKEEGRIAADSWMKGFHEKFASQAQKREQEIKEYTRNADLLGFGPKKQAADIKLIEDKYKDKSTSGIEKANLDAQLRPIEDAVREENKLLAQRESTLKKYYDASYLSVKDYYGGIRAATEEHLEKLRADYAKEAALVRDFSKHASDQKQRIEAATKAKELEARASEAIAADLTKLNELTPEQAKATDAYRLEVEKLNAELAKLQGHLAENVAENFDRMHAALTKRATAEGDSGTLSRLEETKRLTVAQGELNEQHRAAQQILDGLRVREDGINQNVRLGQINELDGMQQIGRARADALAQLQAIDEHMIEIAMQSGNPQMLLMATQFDRKIQDLAASSDLLGNKLRDAFGNAFAKELEGVVNRTKSLHQAVTDFATSITNMITQMASQALAKELFGDLFSAAGGSGGGGLGGLFGVIASLFGGAMADGGDTTPGKFYRVNENGPELFTVANRTYLMAGNESGRVTPFSGSAGMGGRSTVMHLNINVPPGTSRQSSQQQAAEIMRHAQIASTRNT